MDTFSASRLLKRIENISHEKFVIHGATSRRSLLIPKKPQPTARNKDCHQKAIYASSVLVVGIIYAVIQGDPRWKYVRREGISLTIPEGGYRFCEGYIHVCDRKDFKIGNALTSLSKRPVRPVEIIKVHPAVLEFLEQTRQLTFVRKRPRHLFYDEYEQPEYD